MRVPHVGDGSIFPSGGIRLVAGPPASQTKSQYQNEDDFRFAKIRQLGDLQKDETHGNHRNHNLRGRLHPARWIIKKETNLLPQNLLIAMLFALTGSALDHPILRPPKSYRKTAIQRVYEIQNDVVFNSP